MNGLQEALHEAPFFLGFVFTLVAGSVLIFIGAGAVELYKSVVGLVKREDLQVIRRFIWVELHGTRNLIQGLFWRFICFIQRIESSPQAKRAADVLKQMAKEGHVRTTMPFTRQNWRLTKEFWEGHHK